MFQLKNQETKLLHLVVSILNRKSIKFGDRLVRLGVSLFGLQKSEKDYKEENNDIAELQYSNT